MIFVIFFVIFLFVYTLYNNKKSTLPPGPWRLPFIGNVHQIGECPFLAHSQFAKRYGDIHYVSMFGQPVVVLNSVEVLKECRFDSSDDYSHRPIWMNNFSKIFAPGTLGKGVDDYHENRKFLLSHLKKRGMGKSSLEHSVLQEVEQMITHMKKNSEVDPNSVILRFNSNIIMTMCFEKRWDYEDPDYEIFNKAVSSMLQQSSMFLLEDFAPFFSFLPAFKTAKKITLASTGQIRKMFKDIINERITGKATVEHNDLVDDYIKIHKDFNEKEMKNIIDICQDTFFAGSDTTAATTNFAIIHILNNPSWQEQVFNELESVLKGRRPSMLDLQNLPKIEATIQETLRMNLVAPMLFHATKHAMKLREHVIPSNCLVLINAYHINYDPATFPDPFCFNPKRWLRPDGKFRSDLVEKVLTFGLGRRVCIGRPLARMNMSLIIVRLMQDFIFTVPDGHAVPSGALPQTGEIQPHAPVYKLKLIKRVEE